MVLPPSHAPDSRKKLRMRFDDYCEYLLHSHDDDPIYLFDRKFGERAYTLHHRFYLHLGHDDNLWLSAEDGCEGQVAKSPASRARRWPF